MTEVVPSKEISMNKLAEEYLQKTIFPELEQGRPNWDKPHTITVVHYIGEIMKANPELRLDPEVLTIAAYAHDWGYAGLFDHGKYVSRDDMQNQKVAHMQIGAQKIEQLLSHPEFDYLTTEQKTRIIHLVAVHDRLEDLKDTDELVLMEADTLGVADSDAVKPTHNYEDYQAWLKKTQNERVARFITDYSKQKVAQLLVKRDEYYRNQS